MISHTWQLLQKQKTHLELILYFIELNKKKGREGKYEEIPCIEEHDAQNPWKS